jgi:hypothetical protein
MALRTKAPEDRLDYLVPLPLPLLAGETILGGTVTVLPAGLTVDSVQLDGADLLVWLAAGAAQTLYTLAFTASTSQGRGFVWRVTLYVGTSGLDDPAAIGASTAVPAASGEGPGFLAFTFG